MYYFYTPGSHRQHSISPIPFFPVPIAGAMTLPQPSFYQISRPFYRLYTIFTFERSGIQKNENNSSNSCMFGVWVPNV
jgi:hypothetical protein